MKILVIMGTLRRRYSYQLVKMIEEVFTNSDKEVFFKYIFFDEYKLSYCAGCGKCKDDESLCPIDDDSFKIREEILSCDLMIINNTVYENNVTAILKNFFDRFHYFIIRPLAARKFAILVSVSSYSGIKTTLDYMEWVAESSGFDVVGKIGVHSHFLNDDKAKKALVIDIKNIHERFVQIMKSGISIIPDLKKLMIFKDQKKRIISIKSRYQKAYQYWVDNGWLNKIYFNDLKIHPLKKLILKFLNISIKK